MLPGELSGRGFFAYEVLKAAGNDLTRYSRTEESFRKIFENANMKIKKTELQRGMPDSIYPVRTYALQPRA